MYDRTSKHFHLIGALILLVCAQSGLAYINTGYEIIDLNTTNGAAFAKEAQAWSATRLYSGTIISSMCGDTWLLGGFQVLGLPGQSQRSDYFQRVYSNLPPHTMIRFTINVWAIDSWDPGSSDGFTITFDQTVVDGLHIPFAYHPINICGQNANDWKELRDIRVMGTVAHSASSLTFKFNSFLDEDSNNESVGFRDVNFAFIQANVTAPTLCGIAGSPIPKGQCACPEGQFQNIVNGVASCNKCHASCSSCFGPTEAQCYSCSRPGYGKLSYGWDGTKCVACAANCFTCNGANPGVCLPCPAGQIYYPEIGACRDYCDFPMSLSNTQYGSTCSYPCPSGQYLTGSGGCTTSCPAPNQMLLIDSYYKLCVN